MKTAYELLGIPPTATPSEIEQCYRFSLNAHIVQCGSRRLSKKERAQVRAMRAAYLLLASPKRRHAYDIVLEQRAQWRRRVIDTGGMALAVLSLVIGVALIGDALRVKQPESESSQPQRLATAATGEAQSASSPNSGNSRQTR